jgi:hypothetical protein
VVIGEFTSLLFLLYNQFWDLINNFGLYNQSQINCKDYILNINQENQFYLKEIFNKEDLLKFNTAVKEIKCNDIKTAVEKYSIIYESYIKECYRKQTYPNYDKQFSKNIYS